MSKVLIVANTKNQADLIAKMHDLRPWQWRYAHTHRFLQGLPQGSTVLVAANYAETPQRRETFAPDGTTVIGSHLVWPMGEELRLLRAFGVEVAMVAT